MTANAHAALQFATKANCFCFSWSTLAAWPLTRLRGSNERPFSTLGDRWHTFGVSTFFFPKGKYTNFHPVSYCLFGLLKLFGRQMWRWSPNIFPPAPIGLVGYLHLPPVCRARSTFFFRCRAGLEAAAGPNPGRSLLGPPLSPLDWRPRR